MNESERLANVLRDQFGQQPLPQLNEEIWVRSPALKVIDCVLSLNRNYHRMVLPRIQRFEQDHPEISNIAQLRDLIELYETPLSFSMAELKYKDARRADILVGVIDYLVRMQGMHDGENEAVRLFKWAESSKPQDYRDVRVKGFALAGFQYLRMLFGAQTTKPDIHIIAFVTESIDRRVTAIQALNLLVSAAKLAGLPIRELDAAIWASRARNEKPTCSKQNTCTSS